MVPRYSTAAGIAVSVTFGLLFIMQLLIATGRASLNPSRSSYVLDFVRVERPPPVETTRTPPEKLPPPDAPPDRPSTDPAGEFGGGLAVEITTPELGPGTEARVIGFGIADGDHLPIFKVEPIYPTLARRQGIEGHAIVEYVVTRAGTTADIRVVESSHSVFERACANAAEKFKYKPRVIDGEPVEVHGVQNLCRFRLEN